MSGRGMRLRAHAATDRGLVRDSNEDSFFVGHTIFAVADGMGGHVAGEVASRKALEPVSDLDGRQFATPQQAQDALVEAITAANEAVVKEGDEQPQLQGMGTTLTAVMVRDGRLHLAHVGDSRAYLLRRGEDISQLTTDHTLVEQLVREGRLSREQAAVHPQRSMITRAIGVERHVKVDSLPPIELQPGDRVLLCSDGLTGPVDDERITELLDATDDGEEACRSLIDAANDAGGPDNVTVVLLMVDGEPTGDGVVPGAVATAAAAGATTKRIRTREEGVDSGDWAERMGRYGKTQGADGTGLGDRRTPGGRGWTRAAAILVGVVLLLGLLGGGGWAVLSRAYFVGDLDGSIAIYNGIPQTVAGLSLHWVREETDVSTDDLPPFRAEQVRQGVPVGSLTEAREVVENYRQRAEERTAPSTDATETPSPGATSTPTDTFGDSTTGDTTTGGTTSPTDGATGEGAAP